MNLEDLQNQMAGERKPRAVPPDDPFAAFTPPANQPVISGQPVAEPPPMAPVSAPPPPRAMYTSYPPAVPAQAPSAPPNTAPQVPASPTASGYRPSASANRKTPKAARSAGYPSAPGKTKPLLISAGLGLVLMLVAAFSFVGPSCGGVTGLNDFQPYYQPDIRVTDEGDGNVGVFNGTMMPLIVKYIIVNGGLVHPVNEEIPPRDQRNYSTPFRGEITFVRVQTNHPANGGVKAGPPDAKPEIKKDDSGKGANFFGI